MKKIATKKPTEASKLTREDWLAASFQAVVEGGFDNARVLTLAARLGVTRGSFYWHFTDHADLISALVAHWREQERGINVSMRAQPHPDAQQELENLLETALAHTGREMENVRFELALRGLGRRDQGIANMLIEVDAERLDLFTHKFTRLTGNSQQASELATLFYLSIVGSYQALSRPVNPPQIREYLRGIIGKYLIKQQVATKTM